MLLWKETGPQATSVVWLGLGLVLFESGWRYHRLHLRIQGYAVFAAATIALVANNILGEFGEFRWLIVTPGIAIFYYLYWRLIQPLVDDSWHATEQNLVEIPGYLASALLALLIWKQTPPLWLGLPWLIVGLALFETGSKFVRLHLRIHGYLIATAALVATLGINLYGILGATFLDPPSRWIVVPPVVIAFYALYWRLNSRLTERLWHPLENRYAEISCHAATVLLTILLWKELSSVAVALAWGVLGLILYEAGSKLNWKPLRLQGHVLMAMTFARLFMANFAALTDVWGVSHRLVTVVPIVAIFYHLRYWVAQSLKLGHATRLDFRLPHAYSFGAAILLVVLARFELGRTHTVMAWSLLWFVLLVLGVRFNDRSFRIQAYLIAILTFIRSWTTNFYLLGSFFGIPERIATTIPVILALLVATYVSRAARPGSEAKEAQPTIARFVQLFDKNGRMLFPIFATLLATILLFYQVEGNLLTISWTVEALALMILGFLTLERIFRLLGLGLFAICLIKLVFIDLAGVETLFRILSFIVLGLILLVVSFAYTRYRDTIKRFV